MSALGISDSPDRVVAQAIVARFVAEKLLPAIYAERTETQLAGGEMQEDDWRLLAEKALEIQARSVTNE